jgi:ATP-dependent protease HslVU (ClpYQ) peptidase subunit
MTTIAAVQGRGWAVVGYDSLVSISTGGRSYGLPTDAGKCFEVGEYLFGIAGDFRAVNIVSHNFRPPDAGKNSGTELDKFMVSKFVPALKKCFSDNSYGKDAEHGSDILVVANATVYELGAYYDCLRDSRGLYAIGSGGDYALGALIALDGEGRRTVGKAKENMERALQIAAYVDTATSEPIYIRTKR